MRYAQVTFSVAISIALFLLFAGACRAQYAAAPSGEVDFDMRGDAPSMGRASSSLYDTTLQVGTQTASGLGANLYVSQRYGTTAIQQAAVSQTSGANTLQAGLVRLPFGIYDTRETYASGLIGYPLVRNDYGYSSVDWGVPGVKWSGGSAKLQAEIAGFNGRSTGIWNNFQNVSGGAGRVQTYFGDLIVGVSHWSGFYDDWGTNSMDLYGLDLRYTRPHLVMRGEYITGTSGDDYGRGWYVDTYYRLPVYERFTLAARVEQFKPGNDQPQGHQLTLGVRYTAPQNWVYSINWRINNLNSAYEGAETPYTGPHGEVLAQIFRRVEF